MSPLDGNSEEFAHYPPGVSRHLDYEKRTIPEYLRRAAALSPARAAYVFRGRDFTFAEVLRLVRRLARRLGALGVGKGDRVLVCLPNVPQSPLAILAIWELGATAVMSNPLNSAKEIAFQLRNSGARLVITLDVLMPRFEEAVAAAGVSVDFVATHLSDFMPTIERLLFPLVQRDLYRRIPRAPRVHAFLPLVAPTDDDAKEAPPACELGDLAVLLYTGGSTGDPKAVLIRHRNISMNAQQIVTWLSCFREASEVVLGVFPFFTGSGLTALMCGSIMRRGTVVLVPRPRPGEMLDLIERHRVTVCPAVPTLYAGMLADPKFDSKARSALRSLRACVSGAAPLAEETKRRWEEVTGVTIIELYGLSETTAMTHGNPYHRTKLRSVGLPISDTECRIVDPEEGVRTMKVGEVGEICLRGPQIADGYLDSPDATSAAFRNGWLHTGDLGYIDEEGYLFIVDRKKEMVISSGYNIYPREVDEVLLMHPAVQEAATVGVSDSYRGESLKAYVSLKPGATASGEELEAHCRRHLAAYKIPRSFEFLPTLPKNAMGKILKKELKLAAQRSNTRAGDATPAETMQRDSV